VNDQDTAAGVSVAEAAQALGVGEKTIRRRIQRGELPAVRMERPQGHEWRVMLDPVTTRTNGRANGVVQRGDQVVDQMDRDRVENADQVTTALRLAETLADQLAHEREQATARLAERDRRIADLEQERFQLAGQLGFYQAQLETAREQIKLLEAPKTPSGPEVPPPQAPRRAWWQFWRSVAPATSRA
jgi:excisionase family DNA binding protein